MEINERIRYLRKDRLHLTLDQFGEKIGLKKSGLSLIENGHNAVTDQTIKSICREFGVSEEWLLAEKGDPFIAQTRNQKVQSFADQVMAEEDDSFKRRLVDALSDLTETEWSVLEKIALHSSARGNNQNGFNVRNAYDDIPDDPQELEKKYPPVPDLNSDAG